MRSALLVYIACPFPKNSPVSSLRVFLRYISPYVFPFPSPYVYVSLCCVSLLFIALYLLGVFLSSSLTQLYTEPSIGELFSISGPQGK